MNEREILAQIESIPLDRPIAIDFETPDLKDYRPELLAIAWNTSTRVGSYVFEIDRMTENCQAALKKRIEKAYRVISHNIFFELRVLYYWGVSVFKLFGKIEDSMILIGVQNTAGLKGLKENAHHVDMKLSTYKESRAAGRDAFIEYCRDDAIACLKLFEKFLPQATVTKTEVAYQMELRLVWVVLKAYLNGFFVDREAFVRAKETVGEQVHQQSAELMIRAGKDLNVNSSVQLRELFYSDYGVEVNPDFMTDGGKSGIPQPGTNEKALEDIGIRYHNQPAGDFAKALLEYRKLNKFYTAFLGEGFQSKIEPDGRIRTVLNQLGTATSRMSSDSPNLQQIPARGVGKIMRNFFIASPGNKLLQIDYSQIEYRFAVHYMQDSSLIEAYKRGEDFHTATSKIFGVDRELGKKLNFTLIYLGGPMKLGITMGIELSEARKYYDMYHAGIPKLKQYYRSAEAFTRMTGGVRMMSGRIRSFEEQIRNENYITSEVGNTVIQGNAGELIKLAMIQIDDILPSEVKFLLSVHDEVLFEGPEPVLQELAPEVKHIMENVLELSVPIIAEPKIVTSWAEAKD